MIHNQSRSHAEASTDNIEKLHDLLDEYQSLVASGVAPSIDEFIEKHPDAASELRRLLPVADVLADFSGDPTASSRPVFSGDATERKTLGDFRLLGELGRGNQLTACLQCVEGLAVGVCVASIHSVSFLSTVLVAGVAGCCNVLVEEFAVSSTEPLNVRVGLRVVEIVFSLFQFGHA